MMSGMLPIPNEELFPEFTIEDLSYRAFSSKDHFEALLQRISVRLSVWCNSSSLDPEPDDLFQEIVCRILTSGKSFDRKKGPYISWVFGIAYNVRNTRYKTFQKSRNFDNSDVIDEIQLHATTTWRRVARREIRSVIEEFYAQLSSLDQLIFRLVGLEGIGRKKALEEIRRDHPIAKPISQAAVGQRLYLMRKNLRQLIGDDNLRLWGLNWNDGDTE